MPMKILAAGALIHELKPLLQHLNSQEHMRSGAFPKIRSLYLCHDIQVMITGMGIGNVRESMEQLLQEFSPELVVSMGFGGALDSRLRIADLVIARSVFLVSGDSVRKSISISDANRLIARVGNRMSLKGGSFFTLDTPMQKRAVRLLLPAQAESPVCEMETFQMAAIAQERKIPFIAVRSITDAADEDIPNDFFELTDQPGCRQFMQAAGLVFRKPRLLPMAAKLAVRSRTCSKKLWEFFDALLRVV